MNTSTMPRAWVGCLACYNDMELVGAWYPADELATVTIEQVHADGGAYITGLDSADAYRETPDGAVPVAIVEGHEELWCMDHEGFGGLIDGECSPFTAAGVWELIEDLDDDEREALGAYRQNERGEVNAELVEKCRDAYRGRYDSEIKFAQECAEESESFSWNAAWPYSCIDWESAARELMMDHWSAHSKDGTIIVFHSS